MILAITFLIWDKVNLKGIDFKKDTTLGAIIFTLGVLSLASAIRLDIALINMIKAIN